MEVEIQSPLLQNAEGPSEAFLTDDFPALAWVVPWDGASVLPEAATCAETIQIHLHKMYMVA